MDSLYFSWFFFSSFKVFYPLEDNFNPLPDDKFETSEFKEFVDDNFIFDENGRKLTKRVENTVEKGEIVRYEQFLLFPQCFQKACFQGASKGVIVLEWVNVYSTLNFLSANAFNLDRARRYVKDD